MSDWRQIQARIRKAKTSSDPPAQLGELYQRTRDAMVAFELAQWHEKAGNAGDTVQWYTTAAQRFRRAQWRVKAEEALTRLGAPIPAASQPPAGELASETAGTDDLSAGPLHAHDSGEFASPPSFDASRDTESEGLLAGNGRHTSAMGAGAPADSAEPAEHEHDSANASAEPPGAPGAGKRRRRGRRGGRKRRGRAGVGEHAAAAPSSARPSLAPPAPAAPPVSRFEDRRAPIEPRAESSASESERYSRPAPSAWQGGSSGGGLVSSRSRAGDPGLSSRIAQLESQLRRLLACPLASLDEADSAPAGPGVLLLSDSDQVTHYFVEACQTLRIGVGNLSRGGRGARGGAQLKPQLAEHLGISESKVSKYLKDNCAVRWIQLDEGAPALANFATAVLRPVVTE